MTSKTVASALLRDLSYLGADGATAAPHAFAFAVDFESALTWPDVAFDTAAPAAHYPLSSRPEMSRLLADVAAVLGERAPRVLAFVNRHMKRALIRRADAVAGASSASNRALVGLCVLTNMHAPADRLLLCAEALLHESIHQYLYVTELADGNFCDLDEHRTYRSPWSGSRIPLHSLVHAAFVWFGLLSLWCQLAQNAPDQDQAALFRDRAARIVFGFAFIGPMLRARGFPTSAMQPQILEVIEHIAQFAGGADHETYRRRKVGEALCLSEGGGWLPALTSRLAHIGRE
jgi:HEXXH motif-containing protein